MSLPFVSHLEKQMNDDYSNLKSKLLQSLINFFVALQISLMLMTYFIWWHKIALICEAGLGYFIYKICCNVSDLYDYFQICAVVKRQQVIRNDYLNYYPTALPIKTHLFASYQETVSPIQHGLAPMYYSHQQHSIPLHHPTTTSTPQFVNNTIEYQPQQQQEQAFGNNEFNMAHQTFENEPVIYPCTPVQEQNNEFNYNAMEQTNENDYPIATYHPTAYQQAVVPTYCPQQEQKQSFIGNNEFNGPLYQYTPIRPEQTGFGTNISIPDNNPYLPQRNNYRHQHNPQTVNINTSFGPLSSFKFTYEKTPAKNEVIACKESEKVVHGYVKTFYAKALALALLNIIIEYSNVTDLWSKDSDKIIKRSDDRTGISTGCCDKYVVALGSKIVTKLWKEVWTVRFKNNVSVPIIGIVEKGCTSRQDAIVVYATSWRTLFVVDLELDMKQET
eukprot:76392_1